MEKQRQYWSTRVKVEGKVVKVTFKKCTGVRPNSNIKDDDFFSKKQSSWSIRRD